MFALRWGPPNDEGLPSHRLGRLGVQFYQPAEVIGSSWVDELQVQAVLPLPAFFLRLRHFVFPFHDSTIEVAADDYTAATRRAPMGEAVPDAVRDLIAGLG